MLQRRAFILALVGLLVALPAQAQAPIKPTVGPNVLKNIESMLDYFEAFYGEAPTAIFASPRVLKLLKKQHVHNSDGEDIHFHPHPKGVLSPFYVRVVGVTKQAWFKVVK